MPLEILITRRVDGTCLILPDGSIDSDTAAEFESKVSELIAVPEKTIIIDMAKVTYISSAGLAVIFKGKKIVSGNNGSFMLTNLQPQVQKVFDIIKALPKENIFASIEEADEYLKAIQNRELGQLDE